VWLNKMGVGGFGRGFERWWSRVLPGSQADLAHFFNRKRGSKGSKIIFEKGYYFFLTTLPGHTCREKIRDPED
jgi:hypothetical protein